MAARAVFRVLVNHGAALIGIPEASVLLLLALVTLIAAILQGAVGFGFGLLALPGYMWAVSSLDAVPLVIIVNLSICMGLAARLRREVDLAILGWMLLGALGGFPIGVMAFQHVGGDQLMLVVSVAVLLCAVGLVRQRPSEVLLAREGLSYRKPSAAGAGLIAGAMTVALGIPGPPVVLYLTTIGASKDTLRATALTFFATAYLVSLLLQSAVIGLASGVWVSAALLLPVAAVGGLVGNWLSRRISEDVFRRVTLALIVAVGISTLLGVLLR